MAVRRGVHDRLAGDRRAELGRYRGRRGGRRATCCSAVWSPTTGRPGTARIGHPPTRTPRLVIILLAPGRSLAWWRRTVRRWLRRLLFAPDGVRCGEGLRRVG